MTKPVTLDTTGSQLVPVGKPHQVPAAVEALLLLLPRVHVAEHVVRWPKDVSSKF